MKTLQRRALAGLAMTVETVEDIYDGRRSGTDEQCLKALCESHERLRTELQGAEALLEGTGLWGAEAKDWRIQLRDFAEDSEQHDISHEEWKTHRGNGITLYSFGGFFTAYFDDAAELWNQADDTRPMFHVMVQSDPPHRTVIHPLHLAVWAQYLAAICLPLQIMGRE